MKNRSKEAFERVQRIRQMLRDLYKELRWFRDGDSEVREIFSSVLDWGDLGYISSLLVMLADEDKFGRWKVFTTYKYRGFR